MPPALHRRLAVFALLCLAVGRPHASGQDTVLPTPNIVYILADDMGIGDPGAYNPDSLLPTPHINRLAEEGIRFNDAHTNSAVCSPTRYGILTGRYAWRTSLKRGVLRGYSPLLIEPHEQTVGGLLQSQNYRTACVGKWHLGLDWTSQNGKPIAKHNPRNVDFVQPIIRGPLDVGFDHYYGIAGSLNMDPHAYIHNRHLDANPHTLQHFSSKEAMVEAGFVMPSTTGLRSANYHQHQVVGNLAKNACAWIRDNAGHDQPFFLYMPLPSPHTPLVASEKFAGKSAVGPYGDFCLESDWAVGEVLNTLDELGLTDNTLVIFTSDNGSSLAGRVRDIQAKGHYPNHIYRGIKATTWEGGHRVPFVARWPGVIPPGTQSDQTICSTDLLATCADLLNTDLEPEAGADSVSFLPALLGQTPPPRSPERAIVHHSVEGHFAIREGRWKLLLDNVGGDERKENPKDKPVKNPAELLLFDMVDDPGEHINLSHQHPERVAELKQRLAEIIVRGRSTPGPSAPVTPEELAESAWPQLAPIRPELQALTGG